MLRDYQIEMKNSSHLFAWLFEYIFLRAVIVVSQKVEG